MCATRLDFLSRECFGHCSWLQVSEQLHSITSLPSRGGGCRSLVSGCLQRASRLQTLLWSLPTANLAPEPPDCKPCSRASSPPRCLTLLQAGTPRRLCLGCCDPQSLSPAQRPPLFVPASPSQLCEPSLGIWFVSSWQCHPPKCHGMHKSMKTRDPRHVFLFVCMCQHFQWLRNVCL